MPLQANGDCYIFKATLLLRDWPFMSLVLLGTKRSFLVSEDKYLGPSTARSITNNRAMSSRR
jgi:hypothetical protein